QMNGGMNPQMNGGMNPQMNGGMNPQMNGGMNPQMNGGMNPQMNGGMNPQMNGGMNPQMNGGMNPQMNWGMNPQMNGNPFANMFGGLDMMGLLGALTGTGRGGGGGNGDIVSNLISAFMGNGNMDNAPMNNDMNNNNQNQNQNGNPFGGFDFSELAKMVSSFMGNEQAATNDEVVREERRQDNSNPINSFSAVFSAVSPKDIEAFQGVIGNLFNAAQSAINQTLNIDDIFGGVNLGKVADNLKENEIYKTKVDDIDLDLDNLSLNSLNENLNSENSDIIDVEDVVEVGDEKEEISQNETKKENNQGSRKFTEEELYDIIKILIQLIEPYKLELLKNFLKENAAK
uniref:DUF1720 domain-containing protein n=1 Tax=Clostridium ihumii TaxID=1470356 RepID=UPI00193966F6